MGGKSRSSEVIRSRYSKEVRIRGSLYSTCSRIIIAISLSFWNAYLESWPLALGLDLRIFNSLFCGVPSCCWLIPGVFSRCSGVEYTWRFPCHHQKKKIYLIIQIHRILPSFKIVIDTK